ncbi:MAG: CPBP family intramembrane glutamic endopeptidase [Balneolaceae bacterium]|nr:CPBP family intramembrane glutamic endopeptidase [Balneolaceae bacterium]
MNLRTVRLTAEWAAFFFLVPLLFYFDLLPVPKVLALVAASLGIAAALWRDAGYSFAGDWKGEAGAGEWKSLALRGCAVAAAILTLTLLVQPGQLLGFPQGAPWRWGMVMLLYPFLSALPQELLYRSWFFRRYRPLFGAEAGMVLASALSFSFLHVIYDNPWALGLSFAGGLLFASTYRRSRSLMVVAAEHALYGCLVFTIGMGGYFYEPF